MTANEDIYGKTDPVYSGITNKEANKKSQFNF